MKRRREQVSRRLTGRPSAVGDLYHRGHAAVSLAPGELPRRGPVIPTFARLRRRPRPGRDPRPVSPGTSTPVGGLQRNAAETLLDLLPTAAVLVDAHGRVQLANNAAHRLGIVSGGLIGVPELRALVRRARREGEPRAAELSLEGDAFPRRVRWVGARAVPLGEGNMALAVDDLTEARRVEAVRRDFVANVGHEIKTPVGALTLLAEAALDARDDPEQLMYFVERMNRESGRLSRLVQELLDLSRLQGGDPLPGRTEVAVDVVVEETIDRARAAAELKGIELIHGGDVGLRVTGNETQLVTALTNLLQNAIAYSPAATRVAVGVHHRDGAVEIAVTDQGIGIDPDEQHRIFERFYRVDPARSRDTGGTGLGLAIVKHIVSNHGGEVTVWSRPGEGSTFTIRLPDAGAGPGEFELAEELTDEPVGDAASPAASPTPQEVTA